MERSSCDISPCGVPRPSLADYVRGAAGPREAPQRANGAYAPMPPLKRKKAFAWITASAVALTGTGAFAQLGIRETSIVFGLFVRFALAALILLVMAPLERLRSLRTIPTVQWLRVGFVMCSQSALFVYLAQGTLLNGMLLYNTGPLFTPLLAWMLWRKTIRATGLVSIVLGFVGLAIVLDPTRSALDGLLLVW